MTDVVVVAGNPPMVEGHYTLWALHNSCHEKCDLCMRITPESVGFINGNHVSFLPNRMQERLPVNLHFARLPIR
jgi:hypothetical protein